MRCIYIFTESVPRLNQSISQNICLLSFVPSSSPGGRASRGFNMNAVQKLRPKVTLKSDIQKLCLQVAFKSDVPKVTFKSCIQKWRGLPSKVFQKEKCIFLICPNVRKCQEIQCILYVGIFGAANANQLFTPNKMHFSFLTALLFYAIVACKII